MGVNIGSSVMTDCYVGSKPVQAIYQGSNLIWQRLTNWIMTYYDGDYYYSEGVDSTKVPYTLSNGIPSELSYSHTSNTIVDIFNYKAGESYSLYYNQAYQVPANFVTGSTNGNANYIGVGGVSDGTNNIEVQIKNGFLQVGTATVTLPSTINYSESFNIMEFYVVGTIQNGVLSAGGYITLYQSTTKYCGTTIFSASVTSVSNPTDLKLLMGCSKNGNASVNSVSSVNGCVSVWNWNTYSTGSIRDVKVLDATSQNSSVNWSLNCIQSFASTTSVPTQFLRYTNGIAACIPNININKWLAGGLRLDLYGIGENGATCLGYPCTEGFYILVNIVGQEGVLQYTPNSVTYLYSIIGGNYVSGDAIVGVSLYIEDNVMYMRSAYKGNIGEAVAITTLNPTQSNFFTTGATCNQVTFNVFRFNFSCTNNTLQVEMQGSGVGNVSQIVPIDSDIIDYIKQNGVICVSSAMVGSTPTYVLAPNKGSQSVIDIVGR